MIVLTALASLVAYVLWLRALYAGHFSWRWYSASMILGILNLTLYVI